MHYHYHCHYHCVKGRHRIGHFQQYHNTLCLSSKILHKHCFYFLLGLTIVSRENRNNAYTTFWRTNKEKKLIHALKLRSWYLLVFIFRTPAQCKWSILITARLPTARLTILDHLVLFSLTLCSISMRNLRELFYLLIYSGKGWLEGFVWKMEAPSDGILVFTITGRLIIKVIDNNGSNHDYIKILGSDWSSAGLISAVIVQLHTSCACNCTVVRVMPE